MIYYDDNDLPGSEKRLGRFGDVIDDASVDNYDDDLPGPEKRLGRFGDVIDDASVGNRIGGRVKHTLEDLKIGKKSKGVLREVIEAVVFLVVVSVVLRIFFIEAYTIPSASMRTTFMEGYYDFSSGRFRYFGDRLIAFKFTYGVRIPVLNISLPGVTVPKRGDIIIFEHPEFESPGWEWEFLNLITLGIFRIDNNERSPRILVKRCMAGPGDTLIIDSDKNIYVNGDKLATIEAEPELAESLNLYNYPEDMEIYIETNGDNSYVIQREKNFGYGRTTPTYYIPSKGDILTITRTEVNYGVKYIYMINDFEISDNAWRDVYRLAMSAEMGINFENLQNDRYEHIIGHNYYFGMGDNRDNSRDSRSWGIIKDELIFGSPVFIFFPFNRAGLIK